MISLYLGDVWPTIVIEGEYTASATEVCEVVGTKLATQFSNNIRNNFVLLNHTEDADSA